MNLPTIKNLSSPRYLAHRTLNRFLAQALREKKFGIVLDIGSGKNPYKKFIHCDRYVSLDIENRSGDPDVIITDLNEKIPLGNNYGDCVICTEVLEHVKKPAHALKEINRVLKPGGMLVLTTPMVWIHHEAPNDFFRYTKFALEYLLVDAGFGRITIKPSNTYGYTLAQLMVANLRNSGWRPLVFCINIFGILSNKFSRNYEMPLGHHVIAYKNI